MPIEVLGDPTRRGLFERLRQGPQSVSELVVASGISQPAVSQHLRVLRAAGLVTCRKSGQRRIYALDPAGLSALRTYVESFWDAALLSFQQVAEEVALEEDHDE